MKLYRIYSRQTEPVDNQYFAVYYVWAYDELQAKVTFNKRLRHAVIQDVFLVLGDRPILLLETG
jgi:hypothetical protein